MYDTIAHLKIHDRTCFIINIFFHTIDYLFVLRRNRTPNRTRIVRNFTITESHISILTVPIENLSRRRGITSRKLYMYILKNHTEIAPLFGTGLCIETKLQDRFKVRRHTDNPKFTGRRNRLVSSTGNNNIGALGFHKNGVSCTDFSTQRRQSRCKFRRRCYDPTIGSRLKG